MKQRRFAYIKRHKGEFNVQSGLAMTPGQMLDRAREGKPIASFMADDEMFDDGGTNKSFEVPILRQRGVDVNDIWNEQEDLKKKKHMLMV